MTDLVPAVLIGEVVTPELTKEAAQQLIATAKDGMASAAEALLKLNEGKAYKALGYANFEELVKAEFGISRPTAYRWMNLSANGSEQQKALSAAHKAAKVVSPPKQIEKPASGPEATEAELALPAGGVEELKFQLQKITLDVLTLSPEEASELRSAAITLIETLKARMADDDALLPLGVKA